MKILSIDPSGNFEEGQGVTGLCYETLGGNIVPTLLQASDCDNAMQYYKDIVEFISDYKPKQIVMEGYRLYNHKGMKAQTQSNSIMETSQLIGILRYECWEQCIPLTIQYAVQVKNRWSDEVLLASGLLVKKGNRFYLPDGKLITNHSRDAYRHLLHYKEYGGGK